MNKERKNKKKAVDYESVYSKWLPGFFMALSFLIIILPLQKPVNSARAVLSYIFIPQFRAAHAATDYLKGVNDSVYDLLDVALKNAALEEEIALLKIENAQKDMIKQENERLTSALNITKQSKWGGTWAKVAYREPSRRSTIIVDRGSDHGVELRAPVLGVDGSVVGLLGKVIEVMPTTSKIMLSSDEEFFVTGFLSESRIEGLASGDGHGGMRVKYIPLEAPLSEGENVYTSVSSAIFPDGVLIGRLSLTSAEGDKKLSSAAFLSPALKLAVEPLRVKEVLILAPVDSGQVFAGGKK